MRLSKRLTLFNVFQLNTNSGLSKVLKTLIKKFAFI